MTEIDPDAVQDWTQLDQFGMPTGKPFRGSFSELKAHLLKDLPEGTIPDPPPTAVYVRSLAAKVTCPLVTLTTPWGSTRWIPVPRQRSPRRHAWFLRR